MFKVYLETSQSQRTTPDDAIFNLPQHLLHKYVGLKLCQASIPNLRYNVASTDSLVVGATTYTIAAGAYNATTFSAALNAVLTASRSVSYSSTTDRFSYVSGGAETVSGTLLTLMGFSGTFTTSGVTTTAASYPPRFDGSLYVDVCVSFPTGSIVSGGDYAVLARVPLTENYGGIIHWEDLHDGYKIRVSSAVLNNLRIFLVDDNRTSFTLPYNADCAYTLLCDPVEDMVMPLQSSAPPQKRMRAQ